VISFRSLDRLSLLTVCFSYVVANFIAQISLFASSGLGIRDGVLVAVLKKMMTLRAATFAALLSRLVFVFADILIFVILAISKKVFGISKKVQLQK